jgi:hypothetical protein
VQPWRVGNGRAARRASRGGNAQFCVLTLTPHSGPWQLALFGRNIFGQKYDLEHNFFLGRINIAAPGAPATFGVRLGLKS